MIAENLLQIQYKSPRELVVDKMCAAIREFGLEIPIVVKSDGSVVDVHLKLKAARKLRSNWASWDEDLLKLEFEDLQNMDFNLELTGFDLDQIYKDFLADDEIALRSQFQKLAKILTR
jgi:ParB-like chromosome segregation protein Spo0J